VVADIGIDPQLPDVQAVDVEVATPAGMRRLLPDRPISGHKGTFGRLLIAGGCAAYRGAPLLAARAAFRCGAGLVQLAVPDVVREAAALALPEATSVDMGAHELLDEQSAARLLEALPTCDALCLGPGLGEAADFIAALFTGLGGAPLPLLIDADGLNRLLELPDWPTRLPAQTVLTPHPGEMARLMDISLSELKDMDRIEVTLEKAAEWNVTLLLKGAYTVVAAPDGRATLIPCATPVLAVGGSGDVLSGAITALLGQGLPPYEAAVLGAYLHGLVGEHAPHDRGMLATEIADDLPAALARLQNG